MITYRRFRGRTIVAALMCVALKAGAQSNGTDPLLPRCPAGRTPLVDTTQVLVVLQPARAYLDSAYTEAQLHQISFYADAIARRFQAPATLGDVPTLVDLPAYYDDGDDDGARSVLSGRLILVVKRDGRVRTIAWEYYPLATTLALAVATAAQAASTAGDFDGILRPDDKRTDDTLAIDVRSVRDGEAARFPLMRARLPGYRGQTLAMVAKQGILHYPPSAASQRVGTKGEVRFVVGTDGRVVVPYMLVTRAGWRDFVEPMQKAVTSATYVPATSGGCEVPALVRQKFSFEMRPDE